MSGIKSALIRQKARIIHRYLGFFLAGIMAVYALSGIVLIFRNTHTFKKEIAFEKTVSTGLSAKELGEEISIRKLTYSSTEGNINYFKDGEYNTQTGAVTYVKYELPFLLEKMTHMHMAKTGDTFYYLNIFFGSSLLFFVLSAFWMFMPKAPVFKKGILFTLGGVILTLILLFVG